ncbi:hypothetical protein Nepgr_010729 [Nepenthes gracilis]|uniref:Uncharacterized protein n=1 Tax=Nepenthes gracilis TaxID=150966 RepID=A0AAD3SDH0_NEPGR|nr:hypothetical protein Nepgr_010729 [Nepenthes gracilis]
MEELPVEKRCSRTGTPNWRCPERAMEGKSVCRKHYFLGVQRQQEKRMQPSGDVACRERKLGRVGINGNRLDGGGFSGGSGGGPMMSIAEIFGESVEPYRPVIDFQESKKPYGDGNIGPVVDFLAGEFRGALGSDETIGIDQIVGTGGNCCVNGNRNDDENAERGRSSSPSRSREIVSENVRQCVDCHGIRAQCGDAGGVKMAAQKGKRGRPKGSKNKRKICDGREIRGQGSECGGCIFGGGVNRGSCETAGGNDGRCSLFEVFEGTTGIVAPVNQGSGGIGQLMGKYRCDQAKNLKNERDFHKGEKDKNLFDEVSCGFDSKNEITSSKGRRGRPKGSKNKKKTFAKKEDVEEVSNNWIIIVGGEGAQGEVVAEKDSRTSVGVLCLGNEGDKDRRWLIGKHDTLRGSNNENSGLAFVKDQCLSGEVAVNNGTIPSKRMRGRPKGSKNKKHLSRGVLVEGSMNGSKILGIVEVQDAAWKVVNGAERVEGQVGSESDLGGITVPEMVKHGPSNFSKNEMITPGNENSTALFVEVSHGKREHQKGLENSKKSDEKDFFVGQIKGESKTGSEMVLGAFGENSGANDEPEPFLDTISYQTLRADNGSADCFSRQKKRGRPKGSKNKKTVGGGNWNSAEKTKYEQRQNWEGKIHSSKGDMVLSDQRGTAGEIVIYQTEHEPDLLKASKNSFLDSVGCYTVIRGDSCGLDDFPKKKGRGRPKGSKNKIKVRIGNIPDQVNSFHNGRAESSNMRRPRGRLRQGGRQRKEFPNTGEIFTGIKLSASQLMDVTIRKEQSLMCHQCQRRDKSLIVSCSCCKKKHYCLQCLAKWYPDRTIEEVEKACPFCRGNCNCKACLQKKSVFMAKQKEVNKNVRLQRLIYLISRIYPLLREIQEEQNSEITIEASIQGTQLREEDILRTILDEDDRVYCDSCNTSIVNFHRSCPNPDCSYDLCLACCEELRKGFQPGGAIVVPSHEQFAKEAPSRGTDAKSQIAADRDRYAWESQVLPTNTCMVAIVSNSFKWEAKTDGSIPCPPKECGGCGAHILALRRILGPNWVENLIKSVEELTINYQLPDVSSYQGCHFCCQISSAGAGEKNQK